MERKFKAIIFDLGGVLVDWNPKYLFEKVIDDEDKRNYFLQHICNLDWNEEQDAGRSIKEATEELVTRHPEWKEHIHTYYDRWEEMLAGPIHGTVDILKAVKDTGNYKLYALTNWSAELFPRALELFHFFHWFDGRVVSGEEKMRKPAPEFYQVLLDRFHLEPEETLFIDDSLRNIKAAEALGITCIHFQNPQQLKEALNEYGIID